MSRVLIDIGNTRLKWRAGDAAAVAWHAHDGDPVTALRTLPALAGAEVLIAQVMGATTRDALRAAAAAAGASAVRFADTEAERDGLRIAYDDPARLGVDRFLAMLALWRELRGPFLVASAGTALTVDIVDAEGRHLGGYIAPGLHAMRSAVLDRTRFPHAFDAPADGRPGTSTESCVAEAALAASLGLLERCRRDHDGPAFLSGGDAATLLPHLDPTAWQTREHVVLDGLAALDA